jgi:hypothetical protein
MCLRWQQRKASLMKQSNVVHRLDLFIMCLDFCTLMKYAQKVRLKLYEYKTILKKIKSKCLKESRKIQRAEFVFFVNY